MEKLKKVALSKMKAGRNTEDGKGDAADDEDEEEEEDVGAKPDEVGSSSSSEQVGKCETFGGDGSRVAVTN